MVVGEVGCVGILLIMVVGEVGCPVAPKVPSLPNWKSVVCLPEPSLEEAGWLDSRAGQ